jgi:phosphatidylinositol alpha-1,6-mannosyltransferase
MPEPPRPHVRILLITDNFPPDIGGSAVVAEALACNLSGHIAVAAPAVAGGRKIPGLVAYDRRFPFPVCRVPAFSSSAFASLPRKLRAPLRFAFTQLWTQPRAIRSMLRFLAQHPADVLCVNMLGCYWTVAPLKRRYPHLKTVFYLHGEEISSGQRRRLDGYAHAALRLTDAAVAVSSFTRDAAIKLGLDPARVTVIHNAVDAERFTPGPPDAAIQARFGLAGKRLLLCLARLDERKGQDKLLEAMPEILAAVPDTVLLLVGGGDEEARLRSIAASLQLGTAVLFAGVAANDELVAFYRTADVYVMPNRTTPGGDTEGFGLVFLEAGACARPVIGGRAGGVPDAILDGETGYLVNGTSPSEIAQACIRLLTDLELAFRIGQNGLAHSRRHTWKAQAEKFLALCDAL